MKSYTNLEQSRKLAEILPLESADMYYPYDLDSRKEENGIITILKIGTHHNTTDIAGICYYSEGWHKFEVHTLSKYAKEEFDKVINAVKYKIKNL